MTISRAVGRWIERHLQSGRSGLANRLLSGLDEHFNLRYLADRLQHEADTIRDYLCQAKEQIAQSESAPDANTLRISIVSPVYGISLKYVRRYIRSIQRQTHENWELCFCIDGDPNTEVQTYLESLAAREPNRYRLTLHTTNQGICAATRDALSLVSGDIAVFADTDDILPPETLNILSHAFAAGEDTDIVYTNHDILTPWGYRIDPIYKPAWSPELLLACNYITHLVAVRRSCLDRVDGAWGENVNGCQDWDFLFRATSLARRIHHVPIVLYHWRAIGGSEATRGKPWAWEAAMRLQQERLTSLDQRICWNFDTDSGRPAMEFTPGHAPPLRVFLVGNGAAEQAGMKRIERSDYPGSMELITCKLTGDDILEQAATLDHCIEEAARPDDPDSLLLGFMYGAYAEDTPMLGLISQAAYASLPGVGCAWPFYGPWRGTYGPSQGILLGRRTQTGFFTDWSANCLTGPLNGMVVRQSVWARAGGFRGCCDQVALPQPVDALGALLGLNLLGHGLRNVAVNTIVSTWMPPPLDLKELNPALDPYI